MDSITHIVLGATIGELVAGRRLGKKAMLLGALTQTLPDIDFVASFWLDTSRDVLAHRGITHSFFFILIMAPLLARMAKRKWRDAPLSMKGLDAVLRAATFRTYYFGCLQRIWHGMVRAL